MDGQAEIRARNVRAKTNNVPEIMRCGVLYYLFLLQDRPFYLKIHLWPFRSQALSVR